MVAIMNGEVDISHLPAGLYFLRILLFTPVRGQRP